MAKIFPILLATLTIFLSSEVVTGEALAQNQRSITSEELRLIRTNPLAAGTPIFNSAAQAYNQRIDQTYANQPKEQRPYATPRQMATRIDDAMKKYHRGDQAEAMALTSILGVALPIEDRVALVEKMVQAYLQSNP